jgi:N-acetylglucosaminyl-diphospho-decaprenol L-rhamnosyltransferase
VLLLNPDTESRAGALKALVHFAASNPGHGLYGGRTVRPDGSTEISSCWGLPTLWSTFCLSSGLTSLFRRNTLFDPESLGRWDRDSVREVGMITGCLLLTPRTVWEELNGLDERYFVYGEDADLSARARSRGYRPIMTPDAEIIHVVGISSADDGGRTVLLMAGKITYARLQWTGWRRSAAQQLLRYGVGLRATVARLSGRKNKWRAAWDRRPEWWNGFPARRTL